MNKKLIALALTALPVAAMADVTVYGTIKGAFENDRVKGTASVNRVQDYGSRIGFKGSEDVGNGLKAIWQVESGVNIDGSGDAGTGTNGWATRQSFIGLSGGFGAVLLGHLDGQLKNHQEFDPWEYDSGVNGNYTYTRNDIRVKNAIAYQSPTWAGFDFLAAYSTKVTGNGVENRDTGAPDQYAAQIGLNYKHDSGFFANYSYQNIGNSRANNDGVADTKNSDQHRITAGYDANNLLAVLSYQQIKGFGANWAGLGGEAKSKEMVFTVAYSFGAITPKFSYAHGWNLKPANGGSDEDDTGYNQYIVGVDYALSKRTVAGLSYGYQKFEDGVPNLNSLNDNRTQQTVGVNIVHSF